MDETAKRLGEELADAIRRAVESDPDVAACRQMAGASGYEVDLTLDARVTFEARPDRAGAMRERAAASHPAAAPVPSGAPDFSDQDRRFLRSLRIAPDPPLRIRG